MQKHLPHKEETFVELFAASPSNYVKEFASKHPSAESAFFYAAWMARQPGQSAAASNDFRALATAEEKVVLPLRALSIQWAQRHAPQPDPDLPLIELHIRIQMSLLSVLDDSIASHEALPDEVLPGLDKSIQDTRDELECTLLPVDTLIHYARIWRSCGGAEVELELLKHTDYYVTESELAEAIEEALLRPRNKSTTFEQRVARLVSANETKINQQAFPLHYVLQLWDVHTERQEDITSATRIMRQCNVLPEALFAAYRALLDGPPVVYPACTLKTVKIVQIMTRLLGDMCSEPNEHTKDCFVSLDNRLRRILAANALPPPEIDIVKECQQQICDCAANAMAGAGLGQRSIVFTGSAVF